ncbi:MAG TPA: helix-turn-helix domain-containing protein [Bryobacteraceae bacterium]|nr:helix-turn-helix domain-containing protein [Bryobacteraceae bacterium]
MAIGRRIREIRGFDLTQVEFARILGIGQTQLSRYELGQSEVTLTVLLRLTLHSAKSLDWLLLGKALRQEKLGSEKSASSEESVGH